MVGIKAAVASPQRMVLRNICLSSCDARNVGWKTRQKPPGSADEHMFIVNDELSLGCAATRGAV
jgi:hypothetical protein